MRRAALPRRGRPPPRFGINTKDTTRLSSREAGLPCGFSLQSALSYTGTDACHKLTGSTLSTAACRKAIRTLLASGSLGSLVRELPEASVPSANALPQDANALPQDANALPQDANALSQERKLQSQRLQELQFAESESAAGAASRLRTPSAGLLTPRGWPEARSPARCARLRRRGCSGRGRRRRLSSRPQAQGPCPPAPRPSGRA